MKKISDMRPHLTGLPEWRKRRSVGLCLKPNGTHMLRNTSGLDSALASTKSGTIFSIRLGYSHLPSCIPKHTYNHGVSVLAGFMDVIVLLCLCLLHMLSIRSRMLKCRFGLSFPYR